MSPSQGTVKQLLWGSLACSTDKSGMMAVSSFRAFSSQG
jgi:hypothetical protein